MDLNAIIIDCSLEAPLVQSTASCQPLPSFHSHTPSRRRTFYFYCYFSLPSTFPSQLPSSLPPAHSRHPLTPSFLLIVIHNLIYFPLCLISINIFSLTLITSSSPFPLPTQTHAQIHTSKCYWRTLFKATSKQFALSIRVYHLMLLLSLHRTRYTISTFTSTPRRRRRWCCGTISSGHSMTQSRFGTRRGLFPFWKGRSLLCMCTKGSLSLFKIYHTHGNCAQWKKRSILIALLFFVGNQLLAFSLSGSRLCQTAF